MKYRRLTNDELADLEQEFVRFLAANTITADDWEALKQESPEKVEQLISLFSDIVFDKTLSKAEYLEHKTPRDIKTFHFQGSKVVMNGIQVDGASNFDFTRDMAPEQMLGQLKLSNARLQLYSAEKRYVKSREREMFEMMESGALISRDGALFKVLEGLKKSSRTAKP